MHSGVSCADLKASLLVSLVMLVGGAGSFANVHIRLLGIADVTNLNEDKRFQESLS